MNRSPHTTYPLRPIDQQLLHACQTGDIHTTQTLLQQGANPNTKDPQREQTPFMIAAQNGNLPMLQLLIQHGANPHIRDSLGYTAFDYALENHQYDTVEYLITQLHFDPNTKDHDGITPFMRAAKNGDIKMLQRLIQLGANPYTTDHQGRNALDYAVIDHQYDTVEYLINQLHLNPNTQDQYGITPFLIATILGDIKMLNLLTQLGADPSIPDKYGKNALHYAVEYRKYDTAQYLLTQLHFDPNAKDKYGITPFLIAVQNGNIPMLQRLIQYGANPYTTDNEGQNALHYAFTNRHHHVAEYLLTELQLDPNIQDHQGITPFLIAVRNGNIAMLQRLIQHGANPNCHDRRGSTAIHYAVQCRLHDIVQYLLTHLHLNPNIQDHNGTTPFLIAAPNGDIKMLKLLLQHGANPYTIDIFGRNALHYAFTNRHHHVAEYLLTELQLDPNIQDHQGITPFLIAVRNGNIPMLQRLIQHGANPHTTDNEGQNALHYAKDPTTTHFLIGLLHLNPNTQDHKGNTPLLTFLKKGEISNAKTIIQLGTHPNIPNHQGQKTTTMPHYNEIQLKKAQPSTITL